MRAEWETRTNAALRRIGSEARGDLRYFGEMASTGDAPNGLIPQKHLGPKRQLHADALLTELFLRDMEILIDFMRVEIEKGIQTTWIADEHNVHGGHHERHFDTRSHFLAVAVGHLIGMYEAATEVIDFAETCQHPFLLLLKRWRGF
ncbi:hypothetical protein [Phaeobacter porticola]|uniref:Uncharacterized protein n=1 Tax=Phaeobacter porticola TaxID=1844006 RepID=A0A1L3I9G8_9RHOB|nr:hypothetical protein [Phaeobacter porticola]APG48695.1 hypothetical protein PhaeoP97_03341 [Phaeobacter porticola]